VSKNEWMFEARLWMRLRIIWWKFGTKQSIEQWTIDMEWMRYKNQDYDIHARWAYEQVLVS